jgi:hypothetical protein
VRGPAAGPGYSNFTVEMPWEPLAGPAVKPPDIGLSARPRRGGDRLMLTSDQVGLPAELKHINKRRKRNQQGLPQ